MADPSLCTGCHLWPSPHGHFSARHITPLAPPYDACDVCGEAIVCPGDYAAVDGTATVHRGPCAQEWRLAQAVRAELAKWAALFPDEKWGDIQP